MFRPGIYSGGAANVNKLLPRSMHVTKTVWREVSRAASSEWTQADVRGESILLQEFSGVSGSTNRTINFHVEKVG